MTESRGDQRKRMSDVVRPRGMVLGLGAALSCALFLPVSAGAQRGQQVDLGNGRDRAIIEALLRDVILHARDVASPVGSPRIIALSDVTLAHCPATVVGPCVSDDVLRHAEIEAFKGAWTFELAQEFRKASTSSVTLERFEQPGVVMGPIVEIEATLSNPARFAISRPAVAGHSALVYVQFARHSNWLILLTEEAQHWKVTATVSDS